FSPDSKYFASGGNDVRIWDTSDWSLVRTFDVGDNLVRAVAFHPHQPWLVAAVKDRTIRAWNLTTGQPLGEPIELEAEAYGLAFRPDGRRLAAACFDQLIRVWEMPGDPSFPPLAKGGQVGSWPATPPTWRLEGHRPEVWAAAYSPDG